MDFLERFQKEIQYRYQNKNLLKNALTHSSYCNEKQWKYERNNERLEFLGDAVLELIASEYLFRNYPELSEGELSKRRSQLVCEANLAHCARKINLSGYISLGKGEQKSGGGERDSLLCDAFEAVIGSIYLDSGYGKAKEFIVRYVLSGEEKKKLFKDNKSLLQEHIQSIMDERIEYKVENVTGPDHQKVYECSCYIGDKKYETGKGRSKKAAEQEAAEQTMTAIKEKSCI